MCADATHDAASTEPAGWPPSNDRQLAAAIGAIADGDAVTWDALGNTGTGLVDALRMIEVMAEAHRLLIEEEDDETLTPPERWGHLEVQGQIGAGAFGEVFRARDPHLDRTVALKLLRPHAFHWNAEARDQAVVQEARLLARIRHPNVVTVYGADRRSDRVGIWTEYVRGRTLDDLIRTSGPRSAQETISIGLDLLGALATVHGTGILHRDIKAENVMREEGGRIVLMDFGIGLDRRRPRRPSSPANVLYGTPLYMAPELLEGGTADAASDLYSVGVLLFYLATGRFPVHGRTLAELREAHRAGRRHLLADYRPDLGPSFTRVIEQALATDPGLRFATAGAFQRALYGVLLESRPAAPGLLSGHWRRDAWRLRRWRAAIVRAARQLVRLAAVVTLVLLLYYAVAYWERKRDDRAISDQIDEAHELANDREFDQALDRLRVDERRLRVRDLVRIAHARSLIYTAWGNYDEARRKIDRAVDEAAALDVDDPLRSRVEAQRAALARDYETALAIYEPAIGRSDALGEEARRRRPMLQVRIGALDAAGRAALDGLRYVADPEPRDVIAYAGVLVLANQTAKAQHAISHLENSDDRAWIQALVALERGDWARARAAIMILKGSEENDLRVTGMLLDVQLALLDTQREPRPETRLTLAWERLVQATPTVQEVHLDASNWLRIDWRLELAHRLGRDEDVAEMLGSNIFTLEDPQAFHIRVLRHAGLICAQRGDAHGLRKILGKLASIAIHQPSRVLAVATDQLEAELQLLGGNVDGALAQLERASERRVDVSLLGSLARAYARSDRPDRCTAIAQLRRDVNARRSTLLQEHPASRWQPIPQTVDGC
ncbi:MAG: serine/threonine-protein kinase [Acidobacteriota bacterium]